MRTSELPLNHQGCARPNPPSAPDHMDIILIPGEGISSSTTPSLQTSEDAISSEIADSTSESVSLGGTSHAELIDGWDSSDKSEAVKLAGKSSDGKEMSDKGLWTDGG